MTNKKIATALAMGLGVIALILLFSSEKKGETYQNILDTYPSVFASEIISSSFLSQKIPYDMNLLHDEVTSQASRYKKVGSYLDFCWPEIEENIYAFPGFSYEKVLVNKVSAAETSTPPFLFVQFMGYLTDPAGTPKLKGDQFSFVAKASECDPHFVFRQIPEEMEKKIIGYVARLPEIEERIRFAEVPDVSVGALEIREDQPTVGIQFGTPMTEDQGEMKYTWSDLYARLNLATGVLEIVHEYGPQTQDIWIED